MKAHVKKGEWEKVYDGFTVRLQQQVDFGLDFVDALVDDVALSSNLPAREQFVEAAKSLPDVPEEFAADIINEKVDGDKAELQLKSAIGRSGTVHMVKEMGIWKMAEGVQWDSGRPESTERVRSLVLSQLDTIRLGIEMHNFLNPARAYDAHTPLDTFWEPLIQSEHLWKRPVNRLQGNSTKVGAKPGRGIGWVWAETTPGNSSTLNVYAVDEDGNWLDADGDGSPD